MRQTLQSSPILLWSVAIAAVVLGFIHWALLLVPAFVGGFYFTKTRVVKLPILQAAFSVSAGWILTALVRDLIEGGRISSRLASFLSLSYAFEIYIVLFLICFLPAVFASASGATLYRSLNQNR